MFRKDFVAIALLLTATQVGAEPLTATQYGDFDRYVLALSWQTGFCQSMHDRNRGEPEECRLQPFATLTLQHLLAQAGEMLQWQVADVGGMHDQPFEG